MQQGEVDYKAHPHPTNVVLCQSCVVKLPRCHLLMLMPCRKRDGSKAELLDYGMPSKRKGGAGGSVLDLDAAGVYRPRTKVRQGFQQADLWRDMLHT